MKKRIFMISLIIALLAAVSCAREEAFPLYSISVDMTELQDVPANNPGVEVLVITTDAPYWILSTPDWVKPETTHGVGCGRSSIVSLTVQPNYRNMVTTTYPRSGEIKISGGRSSVSVPINQLGHTAVFDPDASIGGIPNLEEFLDFVATVNDGEAPIRWMNPQMEVELLADIDLSSVSEWTPIGDVETSGNGISVSAPRGNYFSGVFNGGNHTISNFNASAELRESGTWGLFGYISHATIKNLRVEANVAVSAAGTADAGIVVGTAYCSTIENVKVTATVASTGSNSSRRFALGGIAGAVYSVYSEDAGAAFDSYIRGCDVTANVNLDCGLNTNNNADCMMYGGIAGFCSNPKDISRIHIENCTNSGAMTVKVGRCSGIVPSANAGTYLEHCTNNASQVNTIESGRVGQICCNLGANSHIVDCVNTGDLTTSDPKTTTGGLVALMGDESVYIEGGDRVMNTGVIIGANASYLGLLCANCNRFDHVSGITLGGTLGLYKSSGSHKMYAVNESNVMEYIGRVNADYGDRISEVSFVQTGPDVPDPDPEEKGIRTAEDFLAFAAAVNAGESTEEWENEEGWVNLLADIDFSGVTAWTPVGHVTAPWDGYNPVVTDGHPFTGKFDGNAKRIKNLVLKDEVAKPGEHFGLFGYLGKGAVVQNFVVDASCSLTVNSSVSHSAGVIAGVLYDATVRDITSYASMTYKGSVPGYFHMALIGGIYASEDGCTIDSVHNRGEIKAYNTANLGSGATGIHVAGIVGYANAGDKTNVISSCNNYGSMVSQAGRTSGILGAANRNTEITMCENWGDQFNTMPSDGGGRLGNITCQCNDGSSISFCKNYGNLVSTASGRVGGIVSLANAGSYESNENYGDIISDSEFRGVFFGYTGQASVWTNGKASGRVGAYNGGSYVFDAYSEAEKSRYLGKDGSNSTNGKASFTDIVFDIAAGSGAADPDINVSASFRILFIGNSFTKDAVEHLPGILNAAGLNNVQMVHMYYGGRTIPEYNNGWASSTDYHCYVCNPGQTGWTDISGKSLAVVASAGKWDVVTIQEHTGRQLAWGWTEDEKTAVLGLVDKVKTAQEDFGGTTKLYYILSQAYHNISKAQSGAKPFTDTDGMWTCIADQGKKAVEQCGFDGVISTGAMLQNLRTSSLQNANGLTRDGYHMDFGIARYGAACTIFETAIGPFNGNVTMDGNSYRTKGDSQVDGKWTTAITDARVPIAIHAARYAISSPYEVTDMTGE